MSPLLLGEIAFIFRQEGKDFWAEMDPFVGVLAFLGKEKEECRHPLTSSPKGSLEVPLKGK